MALVMLDNFGNVVGANAEGNISGGDWLTAGSYTSTVTSLDAGQWAPTKVLVARGGSGTNVVGICLQSTQSGTTAPTAYARTGLFILPVAESVTASSKISAAGNGNGAGAVGLTADGLEESCVGTSLTAAASGGFSICQIRL